MSSYHVVFTGTVIYETMYYREIDDEEEECMVKRNEFKKRSRYLAMLTALSLAFSNIGSCVNMVYAAEAESQENGSEEEQEAGGEEENGGSGEEDAGEDSGNDPEEGGSEEENGDGNDSEGENGGEENSGEENSGNENSGEKGESSDQGENQGESEKGENAGEDSSENSSGENKSEENKSEENKDENGSGNEGSGQSGTEEANSPEGGKSTVKENSEAKKGTYKLTYSVDPDEGAKVEGPSSVTAGKNAVFTVEAQEGYVIKNVSCESAEISAVEDIDTASASNAQKKNAGKNDGEKFQTYQIENVEADAEIIVEMDNEDLSVYEAEDSTEINGVTVTAKWNTRESGISADAKLHVEEVTEQSKDKVVEDIEAGKVAQLDPQENQIQDVVVYDITLADADTVYSAWADGTVLVTFTGTEIEEKIAQADKVSVLHVDDTEDKLTQVAAEDVAGETGSEVSFEAEHFSEYAVAFTKKVVKAADAVVSPDMTQDQINDAVKAAAASENKVLEVQAGDYSNGENNHKKVIIDASGMTVLLKGGDYIRAQIITREDAEVVLEGDVTFEGQAKETHNTAAALIVESGKTTFNTNGNTIIIKDYNNGLRVGHVGYDSSDAEFNLIGGGTFDVEESVTIVPNSYSGGGYDDGQAVTKGQGCGFTGSGVVLVRGAKGQRRLEVHDAELKSNKNQQHGIYRHNIDTSKEYFNEHMDPVVFDNATVNLEANTSDGYKDESYSADGNILEVVNGSVLSISNNGYNGYNYGKPSEIGKDTAPGRKYRFADSEIHMDGNHNTNAGFASSKTVIDKTTFTANDSEDSCGIMQMGGLEMTNGSVIEANNNPYGGVWIEYESEISDSKVIANNNGVLCSSSKYMSGIYLAKGNLSITNSVLELKDNPSAITIASPTKNAVKQYENNVIAVQSGEYDIAAETGNQFADKTRNPRSDKYFGRDYVLGGSFQATTANMRYGDNLKGMPFAELNPMIGSEELGSGENYAAPINTSHTALTRFDLHQSANKEAASDVNDFVYYDPNTGDKYAYSFRYNTAAEDLNGTGGNAYVWAPVSVLHYDATEGKINAFGTAVQGNMALVNARGDGSAVGNTGNPEETSDRYAADYTIFGNSMNLTEGELPVAVRDGYKFAGWYVADDEGAAVDYARSGNWAELNKLLNIRFTADSKVSEDINDVSKGQEEKTIYAKWVLPSQYNIVINYINERTGASITASYNSDYMEEGSSYDVNALLNKAIDGYTWIRYEGGQPAGSLNGDLVFNVYYNSNSTSNRGGGSGGGSSSGGHGSIVTSNGGPGVTIQEETVPLAELPTEALPQEPVSIPEDEVPLTALPKTGQNAGKEIVLFVSALVLGAVGFFGKKTKED